MLQPAFSKTRQTRLLQRLAGLAIDAVVVGASGHVHWLSAYKPGWLSTAAMVLFMDGRSVLVAPNTPVDAAVNSVVEVEGNWMGTQRLDQPAEVAGRVRELLFENRVRRIGVDSSAVSTNLMSGFDATVIDADLWQQRRRKDPDEIALIRRAVACTEAMYARAREIIEPGLAELDLYTQLQTAAVKSAGEPLSNLLGNDYACGVAGGPARAGVRAEAGQLWVLDLGPAVGGYFADNCRTFSVDRRPTDVQQKAFDALLTVFPVVEGEAKPGVRCRDLFGRIDNHLKRVYGRGLPHHLGHGVGLWPHEFPHLNPRWDDTLEVGDVFTVEPGIYDEQLRGGIRLENQYLVTPTGVENLVHYPMSLT
jgi:Xaa-Pro aminopeptidase